MKDLKYNARGVSANKKDVHDAIKNLDKGLFPRSFCKVLPDYAEGNNNYCNIMHADTAGTKTSLAYVYWKETGDMNVWKGIVQDAIVMNLDDLACVGAVDNIVLSSTIGRNKNHIPGSIIKALVEGTTSIIKQLKEHNINIHLAGGETADVGDIVRTLDVGFTAFARIHKDAVIVNNIQEGDVIIGLASYGQTTYEEQYNSGIGSNGLTGARHDVLHKDTARKYPESYDHNIPEKFVYTGNKKITDKIKIDIKSSSTDFNVGQLLLSPTRTYLPIVKALLNNYRSRIHGMIHCTGGGQTKVLNFIDGLHIIKDNLLPIPPVFKMIQEASGTDWQEMYQVFNMGHRLEIYVKENDAQAIIDNIKGFNIDTQVIGQCVKAKDKAVTIKSDVGEFNYT